MKHKQIDLNERLKFDCGYDIGHMAVAPGILRIKEAVKATIAQLMFLGTRIR